MNKIKFRVWNKRSKCWGALSIRFPDNGFSSGGLYEISDPDAIIQQFTELKDKNNQEIYEGDILQIDKTTLGAVYYRSESLCYSLGWDKYPWMRYDLHLNRDEHYNFISSNTEILGNIFENPNLLQEEHDKLQKFYSERAAKEIIKEKL